MEPQTQALSKPQLKTRIAPTPSGYLHLGNALSFALTWAVARKQNGKVLLRIDDLDNTRFRKAYLHDIFDTLRFMGLDYDEGPKDATDFTRHYSQHLRLPEYRKLLDKLVGSGMIYACPCSRSQIAALSPQGTYPLTCRSKQVPLDTPGVAWRVRVPENEVITFNDLLLKNCTVPLAQEMPDFVVRRKDGIPAYQIASLADDLMMGVNLIVRGEDLLTSTAAQLFLAQHAGATAFTQATFLHHPIILESDGHKLSKSHQSLSIHQMRRSGLQAPELWRLLAEKLGWQDAAISDAAGFLERFRLENVPLQVPQAQ
ncbi:MAG: glutamate--tRNA ligase family protein [Hymenobacteraceae bacterium]|nr:glutamate--tRNA ligase family protein [Hymenobacteraceae bacterium]